MAVNGNQAGRLNAGTPATWQPLGTGAIALNEDLQGGIHSKTSLAEINAIPGSRLANGMLAFANDTSKYYQYTGGTFSGVSGTTSGGSWAEFSTGGTSTKYWIDYVGGIPGDSTFLENGDEIIPYNTNAYFRLITSADVDSFYQTYVDGVLGTLLITRGG